MALSHPKKEQSHPQTQRWEVGSLANGLGGRSVPSLLRWCGKAEVSPIPQLYQGSPPEDRVLQIDREAPRRLGSCGTLCSSGWRPNFEQ